MKGKKFLIWVASILVASFLGTLLSNYIGSIALIIAEIAAFYVASTWCKKIDADKEAEKEDGLKHVLICKKCGYIGSAKDFEIPYCSCPNCKIQLSETGMLKSEYSAKTPEEKESIKQMWINN